MNDTLRTLILDRPEGSGPVCLFGYDLDALVEHVSRVVAALPDRCRMFLSLIHISEPTRPY